MTLTRGGAHRCLGGGSALAHGAPAQANVPRRPHAPGEGAIGCGAFLVRGLSSQALGTDGPGAREAGRDPGRRLITSTTSGPVRPTRTRSGRLRSRPDRASSFRLLSNMDPIWTPHANEDWTPEGDSRKLSSKFNGRGDWI